MVEKNVYQFFCHQTNGGRYCTTVVSIFDISALVGLLEHFQFQSDQGGDSEVLLCFVKL